MNVFLWGVLCGAVGLACALWLIDALDPDDENDKRGRGAGEGSCLN